MDEHHDELRERRKAKRAETIMQAHQAKKEAEALQARCLPPRPAAAHLRSLRTLPAADLPSSLLTSHIPLRTCADGVRP